MMPKLRWKMEPKPTGLDAVGAAPRSHRYHDGVKTYAIVSPLGGGWVSCLKGWYWVAGWDSEIPYKNTGASPVETVSQAKKYASEYVKKHLEKL